MAQPLHFEPVPLPQTNAARVFLRHLATRGVRVAFGIPGGTVSPFFDALRDVPEIRCITTKHEAIAAFAAVGYARATGLPALVLVTSGPGIINAMSGVAAASLEQLPLIIIGGEVATSASGKGAIQDGSWGGLNCLGMMQSITRWSGSLDQAAGAYSVAEKAWLEAMGTCPGPVFIAAALDAANAPTKYVRMVTLSTPATAVDEKHEAFDEACRLLAMAQRPLLIAGNGARSAHREIVALAERYSLPAVATAHGKGVFPERHPLYVGILGLGQHPSVSEYLREPPDVSLIIGSRINDIATNGWSLPISGSVGTIQIDRDPSLLGRNASLSLGLVGDAQAVVSGLLSRPCGRPRPRNYPRCRSVRAELAWADSVPLKPARVLHGLASAFPGATWCSDIGEHLCQAVHHLRFDSPDQFHVLLGLGSMGSGLGLAMGFKQAHPTRTVIGLCGDGGFLAHIGEVMTCVENRINVVFAVFNDGRWNMVHHGFRAAYGAIPTCLPERVADLAAVAQGLGALGVCVTQPSDLDPERLAILASSGKPLVLDIRIDADEALAQDTRTASLRHFMTSRS